MHELGIETAVDINVCVCVCDCELWNRDGKKTNEWLSNRTQNVREAL